MSHLPATGKAGARQQEVGTVWAKYFLLIFSILGMGILFLREGEEGIKVKHIDVQCVIVDKCKFTKCPFLFL